MNQQGARAEMEQVGEANPSDPHPASVTTDSKRGAGIEVVQGDRIEGMTLAEKIKNTMRDVALLADEAQAAGDHGTWRLLGVVGHTLDAAWTSALAHEEDDG